MYPAAALRQNPTRVGNCTSDRRMSIHASQVLLVLSYRHCCFHLEILKQLQMLVQVQIAAAIALRDGCPLVNGLIVGVW